MKIRKFPTYLGDLLLTDDFVPAALQAALTQLGSRPIWQYGWRSNTRRERFSYWHAHIAGGDGRSRASCEKELVENPANAPVLALFRLLQQGPLRGHEPVRVYLNSHTFGVEGYVHQDNEDTENYFSTVYYVHAVWHQNWSGETVFYTRDESDILTSIFPKPGRAVTFHGAIPHCARAPSRDCTELRISLVIKTQRATGAATSQPQADA